MRTDLSFRLSIPKDFREFTTEIAGAALVLLLCDPMNQEAQRYPAMVEHIAHQAVVMR